MLIRRHPELLLLAAALAILPALAGCATTTPPGGGPPPPGDRVEVPVIPQAPRDRQSLDYRTIAIPTFRNATPEYEIEDYLTNTVIRAFITDGRLEVKPVGQADLELRGKIYRYIREPIVYSDLDQVLLYSVGIWIEVSLHETGSDTPFWRDADLYAKDTYSEVTTPVETEREVQFRLIDNLAADVVNRTLEGWARIQR